MQSSDVFLQTLYLWPLLGIYIMEIIQLNNYQTLSGHIQDISLSYEHFGQPIDAAPVVLVNHALTGNSKVAGEGGWWNALIGPGKMYRHGYLRHTVF